MTVCKEHARAKGLEDDGEVDAQGVVGIGALGLRVGDGELDVAVAVQCQG